MERPEGEWNASSVLDHSLNSQATLALSSKTDADGELTHDPFACRAGRVSKYARKTGETMTAPGSPRLQPANLRTHVRAHSSNGLCEHTPQRASARNQRESRSISDSSLSSEHTSSSSLGHTIQSSQEPNQEHREGLLSEMCLPLPEFELDHLQVDYDSLQAATVIAESLDSDRAPVPPQAGTGNCCLAKGLALMQRITHVPPHLADSFSIRSTSDSLSVMLECACRTREDLLMLISMTLSKLIAWCNDVAYLETAARMRGPNAVLEDLYRVQDLVNQVALLFEQSCAGQVVVLNLRQQLRTSSIEVVQVLLRIQ